jgi:hypothetical protein
VRKSNLRNRVIAAVNPSWLFFVQTTWLFRWHHRTLLQSQKEMFALSQESLSPNTTPQTKTVRA